ncbi:MAG: prolipoprotein diacylglyceryl transferase [Armatimonadetes bacterium]|nr:prolipoprotein diacylglyceryl transferase [Armatimonadota bacterium]
MRSTLFKIFGVPIRAYGLMMVVGFALGLWRASRVSKSRGIEPECVYDLGIITLLSGVLGARLVFILINPTTESFRDFFSVWNGGLSFHGGVFFAVLAALIYTKIVGLSFLKCADLLSPSLAISYAFTRIGCFLNGCCYGSPTTLPWGVRFHEHGTLTPPSHPTQIYAFIASLLIFAILTRLEKMKRAPGFIFVGYLGLYGVYRFLIEFPRKGFSAELWAFGLTQAQAVSVVMVVAAVVVVLAVYRRPAKG